MAVRHQHATHTEDSVSDWLAQVRQRPTEAEIMRRTRLAERAREFRECIGPIDIRADDLRHLSRMESEASD
jgi:hypothetical protein